LPRGGGGLAQDQALAGEIAELDPASLGQGWARSTKAINWSCRNGIAWMRASGFTLAAIATSQLWSSRSDCSFEELPIDMESRRFG